MHFTCVYRHRIRIYSMPKYTSKKHVKVIWSGENVLIINLKVMSHHDGEAGLAISSLSLVQVLKLFSQGRCGQSYISLAMSAWLGQVLKSWGVPTSPLHPYDIYPKSAYGCLLYLMRPPLHGCSLRRTRTVIKALFYVFIYYAPLFEY